MRQVDLAEDEIDDAVEDLVLVGDVVVERHRLDAELAAASERIVSAPTPAGVGDRDGSAQHPFAAERNAFRGLSVTVSDILLPDDSSFVHSTIRFVLST